VKQRLDVEMVVRGLVPTRSQAESYIKLGQVQVNKELVRKSGTLVTPDDNVRLLAAEQYVSRAGLKLASVAKVLGLNFQSKVVLDVG
jgi:23S rRNA (cytidine1920-2'-O)/16S rRNA (cytidine1409-2'-O)-methyltransferase